MSKKQAYSDFITIYFELKDSYDENLERFNEMKAKYEIEIPKLDDSFNDLDTFIKSIDVNKFDKMDPETKKSLCEKLAKHNKEQKLVEKKILLIEDQLGAQSSEYKHHQPDNSVVTDAYNSSAKNTINTEQQNYLDMNSKAYNNGYNSEEEEDYSEEHSIPEEDVLNKIEGLYEELNDIANDFGKDGSENQYEEENQDDLEEAKMMEKLKFSVEDNKNKAFYLEGQVIKLREEYSRKLEELKKLREHSMKNGFFGQTQEDICDEERVSHS